MCCLVLAQHLIDSEFPPSLYVTPWVITLFAHNLEMYLVHRLWVRQTAQQDDEKIKSSPAQAML